jgi:hypothetical protein
LIGTEPLEYFIELIGASAMSSSMLALLMSGADDVIGMEEELLEFVF